VPMKRIVDTIDVAGGQPSGRGGERGGEGAPPAAGLE
jgi:hypothetical protein